MARMWPDAMLEHVNSLPRAEREAPAGDRNAELGRRERRADVRRHVVRAFGRGR